MKPASSPRYEQYGNNVDDALIARDASPIDTQADARGTGTARHSGWCSRKPSCSG